MLQLPINYIKTFLKDKDGTVIIDMVELKGTSFLGLCLISNKKKEIYIYIVDFILLAIVGSYYLIGKECSAIEMSFMIESPSSYRGIDIDVSLLLKNKLSANLSDFDVWSCVFEDCDEEEFVGSFYYLNWSIKQKRYYCQYITDLLSEYTIKKHLEDLCDHLYNSKDYSTYGLRKMLKVNKHSIARLEKNYPLLNKDFYKD